MTDNSELYVHCTPTRKFDIWMKGSVFHALKRLIVLSLRCEKLVSFYRCDVLREPFVRNYNEEKAKGKTITRGIEISSNMINEVLARQMKMKISCISKNPQIDFTISA